MKTKLSVRAEIGERQSNARSPDKKELVSAYSIVAIREGAPVEAITVRIYMGRSASASTVYACVWIRCTDGQWSSGRGSAGGYGYHKESAAIAEALRSANVKLYGTPYVYRDTDVDLKKPFDIGGTGSSGYLQVFEAIARAAGYRGRMLWIAH